MVSAVTNKSKQAPVKKAPVKKAPAATKDLFGSDSEEDDMFSQKPTPKAPAPADSDSEDSESDTLKAPVGSARDRTASGRKVPAGAVSMFGNIGGGNPLAAALSKRRNSSSEVRGFISWYDFHKFFSTYWLSRTHVKRLTLSENTLQNSFKEKIIKGDTFHRTLLFNTLIIHDN